MNMKDLKMYEAPAMDVVELEVSVALLAGSSQFDDDGDSEKPQY